MQHGLNDELESAPERSPEATAALASELQHRFRNNLQLVISLLGLQAERTDKPSISDMLGRMQNRIRVIAHMYSGPQSPSAGSTAVHFGEYLTKLASEMSSFYELGQRVRIQISAADLALSVDEALPLALIANELVSNAFQHAFPNDRKGNIKVGLHYVAQGESDGALAPRAELHVSDDGVGLPAGLAFQSADSMGFHLVRTLARQLDAAVDVKNQTGTSVRLSFPLPKEDWG